MATFTKTITIGKDEVEISRVTDVPTERVTLLAAGWQESTSSAPADATPSEDAAGKPTRTAKPAKSAVLVG